MHDYNQDTYLITKIKNNFIVKVNRQMKWTKPSFFDSQKGIQDFKLTAYFYNMVVLEKHYTKF